MTDAPRIAHRLDTKPCECGGTMIVELDDHYPVMDFNPPIAAFNWFCPTCKRTEQGGLVFIRSE